MPLFDEAGRRIRGVEKKQTAELALARLKVSGKWRPTAFPASQGVARVCAEYLQYEQCVANGSRNAELPGRGSPLSQ